MRLKPLPQKALKLGNNLIIADLHLGYEEALVREGNYIPKAFQEILDDLNSLLMKEKPKRLIINGDLKHSFVPFKREKLELKTFFEEVSPLVKEIVVVKGNHDVGIGWIRELGIEIMDHLELRGWTVVHGDKLVDGERFIIGHEHPAVRLRDEVGALIKVPVFLVDAKLIVLPAFTPWAYGNDVSREIISPFLKKFDTKRAKVLVPLEDEVLDFGEMGTLFEALKKIGNP
ncbi:hypothetical protein PAP_06805 [Palaeococcus pacificus DY20341]|uniref:Calcineurin-like phosphoesterase domain-containing protein n=1 Tax=Palaeococcus pacificus DY20341 TaxID=1343739 RepID=A0A075LUE3_9EURY|nr:metallophosphoesterase [Palaeococcus pacificus]AIF69756.1 hypothetical protein PAP_06805 [Palaeococcus pacificus DY20341]